MKIEPEINPYYLTVLDDMIRIIESGEAGKRIWSIDDITGQCDYSQTKRSTFASWCKFFYVKTPKKKRINYIINDTKPFKDGYFNGNTITLIGILEKYKLGYESKSERVREAFATCVYGYMEDVKDWEYENKESYFDAEVFEEMPF